MLYEYEFLFFGYLRLISISQLNEASLLADKYSHGYMMSDYHILSNSQLLTFKIKIIMDKIIEKLEGFVTKYVEELKESPIKTGIKTLIVLWLISKAKELLK